MKCIYKYQLDLIIGIPQSVDMPIGSEILSVKEQYNEVVLYALVDPTRDKRSRKIVIIATGQEYENLHASQYIGTVSLDRGILMFHVFAGHGKEE